jgi:3-(3-hydroxy-phenyl)propionate hydroxylase
MAGASARSEQAIYRYGYRRSPDQDAKAIVRRPVVVVGAGPVGLSAAIDLALRGVRVVILDDADRIGEGSRGICWSKRTLEIWDRLGIAARMVEKGVTWKLGKVFCGDDLVYAFDLLPEDGHKMPAFINLQQYYVEGALVERAAALAHVPAKACPGLDPGWPPVRRQEHAPSKESVDLRWRNKVVGLDRRNDHVRLAIETPEGRYHLDAEWVIAADGARSTLRDLLGLTFQGVTFEDQFLIADVRMAADFPTERRFWFNPTFHAGQSSLMHRQPDNVWRIDLQLDPHVDAAVEQQPARVIPRLQRILGDRAFELEWVSLYRFNCRRLDRFIHGRVIFVGDAAHQVSPFGARGANSGVQDAENMSWKLAAVLRGEADAALLASYETERMQAADENIAHSTRSTDFIAPHSAAERRLRDAVLALAPRAEFARRMVNSGRLSVATVYDTPLTSPDESEFRGSARLGAPVPDAPVRDRAGAPGFLLEHLGGTAELLYVADGARPNPPAGLALSVIGEDLIDETGLFAERFDATPGATYLLRPDQHLAARWRAFDGAKVGAALDRMLARA